MPRVDTGPDAGLRAGGVPATLNGSSYKFPPSIWQCLSQPVTNQANVRVTFEEGC